jgi:hypothetical protein
MTTALITPANLAHSTDILGTPYVFDMTANLSLLGWATCGLLVGGALTYYLMLDEFRTKHKKHHLNVVEQETARDLCATMVKLYLFVAALTVREAPKCTHICAHIICTDRYTIDVHRPCRGLSSFGSMACCLMR